jgi:hypothetical protein
MRDAVMSALQQPNPRADEPWPVDGDFAVGGFSFLALGPHHTEGVFWQPMIQQAIAAGAEEITAAEYNAARPQPEENQP